MLESGCELSSRFVLVRRLGGGSSGEVWLARDRAQERDVALKLLHANWVGQERAVAALEREYALLHRLRHPNILRVEDLERAGGLVWVVMEYAARGSLAQWRGRALGELLPMLLPVVSALRYVHTQGVVHRDIKPANVLLMADGTPKLADFEAAAHMDGDAPMRGSPFNMSPQQLAGAPPVASDDVYALGATLYELLSGYPPFYPDARPERVWNERPAPLPSSVPAAAADLVARMLAKSPAERPEMEKVENELKTLAQADGTPPPQSRSVRIEPPGVRPGSAAEEPLRSEWRKPRGVARSTERDLRRAGFRRGLAAAALGVGLVALVFVFFFLPRWVEQQGSPVVSAGPAAPTRPAEPQQRDEIDFAALARAKQQAEDLRGPLSERLQVLRARGADAWAGGQLKRAEAELAAGDAHMEAREYHAAVERFQGVAPLLDALEQQAGTVLSQQLELGAAALQEGRSADARRAFELAARIAPDNAQAAAGLKRANTLDAVLELLASAERFEKEGRLREALEHYRKALALDGQTSRASTAIARIEAQLANDAFATAMARGFSALASADHAAARAAFQEAAKIRPDSPEVQQALGQIEQEERTAVIGRKLRAARALEDQERWAEALKEYRGVLELDPTVAAANEGVARVTPRVTLHEELELYLTQPERLFSQPVRAAARETLARAQAIADPGPLLAKQIATLGEWLARAEIPVPVAFQSDNQTEVTIYRVGSLGTFEQRSIELVPGRYTVVGTRPGYRDVRRQIDVFPGAKLEPIVIRCEDPI